MPNDEPEDLIRPPTPPVDPRVARVATKLVERFSSRDGDVNDNDADGNYLHSPQQDPDDADLFEELDKELEQGLDLGGMRERRMEELRREMGKIRDMRENEHGKYTEIADEKEVIRVSANEARCVVHFYHRNFQRCKIMDKHLEAIAPRYFSTRFIRVFVEIVPWLVEKLDIKVLPCVICFVGGVSKDRIIGFEDLGNQDGFETATLEMRLKMCGVLENPKSIGGGMGKMSVSGIRGSGHGRERDDDDDDDPFDLDD